MVVVVADRSGVRLRAFVFPPSLAHSFSFLRRIFSVAYMNCSIIHMIRSQEIALRKLQPSSKTRKSPLVAALEHRNSKK